MKVTNIKPQIKRQGRFSVFLDSKYAFSVSEYDLIRLKLHVGKDISEADAKKLDEEIKYDKARNSCLRLLSYRARSKWEIIDYLKRRKYEPEIIDQTISFLEDKDLINDEKFAKQWTDNRLAFKNASLRQIRSELHQKRVNEQVISKVLNNESVDEVNQIRQLINKKKTQPKYNDELKLMQFLSRRGFSYDKILVALGRRGE